MPFFVFRAGNTLSSRQCFDPPGEYRPFVVMGGLIALAEVAQLIHQATLDLGLGKAVSGTREERGLESQAGVAPVPFLLVAT